MELGDVPAASNILVKAHDSYHDFEPDKLERLFMPRFRQQMALSVGGGIVHIVGVRDSRLVAVYQFPAFVRVNGHVEATGDGYFATEPENQGVGHEFLRKVNPILTEAALLAGAEYLLHLERTRKPSPLHERNGYSFVRTIDVARWLLNEYRKVYAAKPSDLSDSEMRAAREIAGRIK